MDKYALVITSNLYSHSYVEVYLAKSKEDAKVRMRWWFENTAPYVERYYGCCKKGHCYCNDTDAQIAWDSEVENFDGHVVDWLRACVVRCTEVE